MSTQIIGFNLDFVNINWKVLPYELPSALADGQGKEMIPALAKIIKIINHPYSFS